MSKTLDEYIELYNKKVVEPFVRDNRYELYFNSNHGFCEIGSNGKMLIVNQMCGNMRFWRKLLEQVCRISGLSVIGTYCLRDIRSYIKLAGFNITGSEETPDGLRFYCEDFTTGQRATCSPAWKMSNGQRAYYITFEV